jgi:hypothetical protein
MAAASSNTVLVGCKAPNGLILNLDGYEVLSKEHGTVRRVVSDVPPVHLRGNAYPEGKTPRLKGGRFVANDQISDGYVFTPVPVDFWTEWLARNKDGSLVRDRIVIAAQTVDAAEKQARELEAERGLSPRLTEDDERVKATGVKPYDAKDDG